MRWRDTVCTVGLDIGDGCRELIGPGRMAYITPETDLAQTLSLDNGAKIMVDAKLGDFRGESHMLVVRARPVGGSSEDLARYNRVNEALLAAGLGSFAVKDVGQHVEEAYQQVAAGRKGAPNPVDDLLHRLDEARLLFPAMWWHDDPQPGIEEMNELLAIAGAAGVDPAPVVDDFERRWNDAASTTDDDFEAEVRRHTCGQLARAANQRLEAANLPSRWFAFEHEGCDDPLWILLEPPAAETLLERGVLTPCGPIEANYAPPPRA